MSDFPDPWQARWKNARKLHFSSAEKMWEHLREAGYPAARSTVLAWEGSGRSSYPSAEYRPLLAGMNADFAALIREVEERERAGEQLPMDRLSPLVEQAVKKVLVEEQFPRLEALARAIADLRDAVEQLERRQRS